MSCAIIVNLMQPFGRQKEGLQSAQLSVYEQQKKRYKLVFCHFLSSPKGTVQLMFEVHALRGGTKCRREYRSTGKLVDGSQ